MAAQRYEYEVKQVVLKESILEDSTSEYSRHVTCGMFFISGLISTRATSFLK